MSEKDGADQQKGEFENICDEALDNARRDCARMEGYTSSIIEQSKQNPELAAIIWEAIVKSTEALTKVNNQLVQLAQLHLKNKIVSPKKTGDDDDMTGEELDDLLESTGNPFDDARN